MAKARKVEKKARDSARKTEKTTVLSGPDPMGECVALCQKNRWREAVLLCRRLRRKAIENGNEDLHNSLTAALSKVEYSLRRQMAGALIMAARDVLAKEFLLDVT